MGHVAWRGPGGGLEAEARPPPRMNKYVRMYIHDTHARRKQRTCHVVNRSHSTSRVSYLCRQTEPCNVCVFILCFRNVVSSVI